MRLGQRKVLQAVVISLISVLFLAIQVNAVSAKSAADQRTVLYFFWGDGCPHCAKAKPVLAELTQKYPQLEVRAYEVWYVEENQQIMTDMAKAYGFEPKGVPTIFLGDDYWIGYNDQIGQEIEEAVKLCVKGGCKDAGDGIINDDVAVENELPNEHVPEIVAASVQETLSVPLLGEIDLSQKSLWVSTLLIAFVDGVNPCSIWVLTMLLALTLHTGSRKKVVIIGLIFLTVTAGVYALFIAGLFTIFSYINYLTWIQVAVALVALFFGLVNVKDYFWYKEGISFTIADDKKPGIFRGIRRVMDASQSFWGMAGATVVMAAGVSLVEFSCTAGFPVLWTNILASQNVGTGMFIGLLLLYLVIYQLDELVIFFSAVFTLKSSKLEEKHGRILKLIGGMLMLTLAVVMLVNPALMNSLSSSLWIFGAAIAATGLILVLHRWLLPRFGVRIGNEDVPS